MQEKFIDLYQTCFDENGNMKICGRQACIDLLQKLDDTKYGNVKTGYLNIAEINKLYQSLDVNRESEVV